jgi:hypothetical protein
MVEPLVDISARPDFDKSRTHLRITCTLKLRPGEIESQEHSEAKLLLSLASFSGAFHQVISKLQHSTDCLKIKWGLPRKDAREQGRQNLKLNSFAACVEPHGM